MQIPLIILHGAVGAKCQFNELYEKLSTKMEVHIIDLPGHGKQQSTEDEFSIEMFAEFIINWLDKNKIEKVNIFGYSMGGFIGIYLASHYAERFNKIFTLATKFNWSKEIAAREVKLLDPEIIKDKLPGFAETLKKRHSNNDWERNLNKTANMLMAMGRKNPLSDDDLKSINQPVLIGMGDRDNMVIIEESVYSFRLLKNGQLLIFPDTPHPIEKVPVKRLTDEILYFFN